MKICYFKKNLNMKLKIQNLKDKMSQAFFIILFTQFYRGKNFSSLILYVIRIKLENALFFTLR